MKRKTDLIELSEIEIYTRLTVKELEESFRSPWSPIEFLDVDDEDDEPDEEFPDLLSFDTKYADIMVAGGTINSYDQKDPKERHFIVEKINERLDGLARSILISDQAVCSARDFIPAFMPVIKHLQCSGIDFVLVGRDQDMNPLMIGAYKNGETYVNDLFRYIHKKLLE